MTTFLQGLKLAQNSSYKHAAWKRGRVCLNTAKNTDPGVLTDQPLHSYRQLWVRRAAKSELLRA